MVIASKEGGVTMSETMLPPTDVRTIAIWANDSHPETAFTEFDTLTPNPLRCPINGASTNWHNYVPELATQRIRYAFDVFGIDGFFEEIALLADETAENFEELSGFRVSSDQIPGLIADISGSFGIGASAEIWFMTTVLQNETADPKPDDEEKGYDIVTTTGETFQLKASGRKRSKSWLKNYKKNKDVDYVIWAKMSDGEIIGFEEIVEKGEKVEYPAADLGI